jgi:plastocyanin
VVSLGSRIVWTNKVSDAHTITSKSPHWASKELNTGRSYTQTVRRKGSIRYICSIHPFMHGTVIVK